jgi:hypothetical protein
VTEQVPTVPFVGSLTTGRWRGALRAGLARLVIYRFVAANWVPLVVLAGLGILAVGMVMAANEDRGSR